METARQSLTTLIVLSVMISLALGYIATWSGRNVSLRITALILSLTLIPLNWIAFRDLLSRPKTMAVKNLHAPGVCAAVTHANIKEHVGVYMLLRFSGEKEERYIFVPWNLKFAVALQRAQNESRRESGTIIVGDKKCQEQEAKKRGRKGRGGDTFSQNQNDTPGSSTEEGEFRFYPDPVHAPPPKDLSPFYTAPPSLNHLQ